ncbi:MULTISPECIES: potassium channel family protein [Vibrio]|uniref:Capsular biosynthesis protein n=1 Tax=Vibrio diazotrophicus TaxID=685 RepID=A0A2J8H2A4_VIBDI|nr:MULTISPECIES: potassium channel family protein [Vibrio]MCF7363087.1 potassium channel family protein [Vibrio sp. A1-b2]MCZ4373243.1 ion channel [Vibrio diazotrophicus]PNH92387.1 capsular biosynthesis protein [Vibrio diazotrophicus]PNH96775.1 capsular biosynthesis protein [Vibrio diazotrophicus]PNI01906.1 capsular biosynthesis protein [Vibrio diazotrophicus]
MKKDSIKDETKPMGLLSLILSFLALFVISGLLFFPIEPEMRHLFIGLDFLICSIFILQLSVDLIRSTDRVQFMKRHWIDFLASIPMIEPLRYARIFHILRIILVVRSGRAIAKQLLSNRRETTIASILLLLVLMITLGSSFMLFFETKDPHANIQSGGDALWWALVTISTVGYGDHYPVTTAGRLIATAMILCGVGIFGMISGLITSLLTSPDKKQLLNAQREQQMLHQIVVQQNEILRRIGELENKPDNPPQSKPTK